MGRYFKGDIEGKFWFGVQDSNDADFFGVIGEYPQQINYYFGKENLPEIKAGLKKCRDKLGKNLKKLNEFFKKKDYYNDEELEKYLGLPKAETREVLEWYARYQLGQKINNCVKNTGECQFTAEV